MQDDPIPYEQLLQDGAESLSHKKATAIIQSSLAIVSLISSSILIWMIIRSYTRLSTIYHRLLLGMSVADILYSLSLAHFNASAPSEMSYKVWNARGNLATCNAQGFLTYVGAAAAVMYCCSLNLYSLAVVRYRKTDVYIHKNIEPFLHGFPILYALVGTTVLLSMNNLNEGGGGNCYVPVYDPPHCIGYEDGQIREGFEIPCGRGRDGVVTFANVAVLITFFIVPLVVLFSLGLIYSSVMQQEERASRYGARAITTDNPQSNNTEVGTSGTSKISNGIISVISSVKRRRAQAQLQSNSQERSHSRIVLHRAFAFSTAYFMSWAFTTIGVCFDIAGAEWPRVVWYLAKIFNPLQGLFNFGIYMHPKVIRAKTAGGDNLTWCQAISTAFWSTGVNQSERRTGNTRESR